LKSTETEIRTIRVLFPREFQQFRLVEEH